MTDDQLLNTIEELEKAYNELLVKTNQIGAILALGKEVFAECDYLFKQCTTYLNAPNDGGLHAPLPAWKGSNPDPVKTNKAVTDLREIMKEASSLITEVTAYEYQFNSFNKEVISCVTNAMQLHKQGDENS